MGRIGVDGTERIARRFGFLDLSMHRYSAAAAVNQSMGSHFAQVIT
jgi:hypothetical protein